MAIATIAQAAVSTATVTTTATMMGDQARTEDALLAQGRKPVRVLGSSAATSWAAKATATATVTRMWLTVTKSRRSETMAAV
jgi:hypothetical protein